MGDLGILLYEWKQGELTTRCRPESLHIHDRSWLSRLVRFPVLPSFCSGADILDCSHRHASRGRSQGKKDQLAALLLQTAGPAML